MRVLLRPGDERPARLTAGHERLTSLVRAHPSQGPILQVLTGAIAGIVAVAIRFALPLEPQQLPTLPVVVMLAIVTTFVGIWAGIATATVGGILSWYLFLNPYSWSLANGAWIPLLGFAVIAVVIVITAQLYRRAERRAHAREMAVLQSETENARFFAREMAHRLKNSLAIVQAVATQTLGKASPEGAVFGARLKALADASDLLNEHIDTPSAALPDVIEAALKPFGDFRHRFEIEVVPTALPSQDVLTLALILHELTSNAIKYGALSAETGTVRIAAEDRDDKIRLTWVERGKALAEAPQTAGFGSKLIRRASPDAELTFKPEGAECSLSLRAVDPERPERLPFA